VEDQDKDSSNTSDLLGGGAPSLLLWLFLSWLLFDVVVEHRGALWLSGERVSCSRYSPLDFKKKPRKGSVTRELSFHVHSVISRILLSFSIPVNSYRDCLQLFSFIFVLTPIIVNRLFPFVRLSALHLAVYFVLHYRLVPTHVLGLLLYLSDANLDDKVVAKYYQAELCVAVQRVMLIVVLG
jgi:hypothetical protein